MSIIVKYVNLTKPTIVLLVALTGLAQMAADGSLFVSPVQMLLVLFVIVVAAGSANSLNQFIDRDIDAVMERTKKRRPLPLEQVSPTQALTFGIILGVLSTFYLWFRVNPLSALLSLGTILFYIFVYTLWLKRSHYYNIVIGGAAGATAPLIASAAATGHISTLAWILFAIIFTWTPPHFWALALALKEEYEKVKIPMLPNVMGDKRTRLEIGLYTVTLLPLSVAPYFLGLCSVFVLTSSIILWLWYMRETVLRLRDETIAGYRRLFFISIGYLFLVFIAVGIDGALRYFGILSL